MRKAWKCDGNGYVALQQTLLDGKQVSCESCKKLLIQCNFDQAKMDAEVVQGVQQGNSGGDPEEAAAQEPADNKQPVDEPAAEPADPMAWVRSLEPTIIQLPAGTHGRKFPFRCTVCKTRRQPDGKLLEAVSSKPCIIRSWLQKHIDTPSHANNLEAYNAMPPCNEEESEVPCEGFLGG